MDNESKNILVVDDDREIVRAIALTLEAEGYTVLKAYDGLEALDLVTTKNIHLVIIDVMMPKLDGLSAIMRTAAYCKASFSAKSASNARFLPEAAPSINLSISAPLTAIGSRPTAVNTE